MKLLTVGTDFVSAVMNSIASSLAFADMKRVEAYRVFLLGITMLIVFLHSVCPAQTPVATPVTTPVNTPPVPTQTMPSYYSPNGVTLNIAFSQSFSSNWQTGDENQLTFKVLSRSLDERMLGPFKLKSTMQFALGANYRDDSIPSNTVRVSDNEVFAEGVFVYPIRWFVDPYISTSIRTPITESFTYYGSTRTRNANFWDPVTSMQGMGFNYVLSTMSSRFDTRIGVSLQQVRAHYNTLLTDDYTTPTIHETYSPHSGIEFVSNAFFQGDSTVRYTGRLGLFGTFQDLSVWSVRWENETVFRLWKSLGLTWTFNVVHDVKFTRRTQFKQAIMLGLIQDF